MATPPSAGDRPADHDPARPSDPAAAPAGVKPGPHLSRRWRKRLVNVLAVLTCVATLVSVVAVWTHETLFDADAWMEIVGPLADDPAVTDAVATRLTDELFQLVDAQQLATEALPDRAAFLAVPLTNAVEGYLLTAVQELLQTDQFRQIWDRANRITHDTAVQLLRGNAVLGFTITDGTVVLNLLPLLSRAMTFVDSKAPRLFGDRPIPQITDTTPVDQARQELSTAIGRPLPDDFGTFTVLQSDQLASAQRLVIVFDRLVYVLIGLTVLLLIATLVMATNRRRTVLVLGLGIALAMVVANALVAAFEKQVIELVGNQESRAAAAATIDRLVSSLEVSTTALAWLGLLVVVGAFLAGNGRTATNVRRVVTSGAQRARETGTAAVTRSTESGVAAVPVVASHQSAFRVGGVVGAMLWLIVTDITWTKLALILLVLGAYEIVITVLSRVPAEPGPPDAVA